MKTNINNEGMVSTGHTRVDLVKFEIIIFFMSPIGHTHFFTEKKNIRNCNENEENPMQKLEEALVICRFGWFHIKLLFTTLCAVTATVMVTTTSSYMLPSAECDLGLTIMQKGLLNAIPFLGQVVFSPLTGFITDAFGRKVFLVGGHIGIFVCSVLEGISQSYWVLMVGKFIEGISLSFCMSTIAAMVSECTHKYVRSRVLLFYSSFMPISYIITALMSWGLLTKKWNFILVEGYVELHAWNFYFLACSLWSLVAAVLYFILPESPKYLLSHGREREALNVLQCIYYENTGNPKDTFPMATLHMPNTFTPIKKLVLRKQLTAAFSEVKVLFQRPLLFRLVLFSFMSTTSLFAYTALRLWYPQLSAIIESYYEKHNDGAQFCVMINSGMQANNDSFGRSNITVPVTCTSHINDFATYLSGISMGFIAIGFIVISGSFIKYVGQKALIFMSFILCGLCSGLMYWTKSPMQVSLLASATFAFMQTASNFKCNVLLRSFPTTVRSLAFSMMITVGRSGALLGNVMFPVMLQGGCMAPFLTLSVICLCIAGLVYFLPDPDKNNNGNDDK